MTNEATTTAAECTYCGLEVDVWTHECGYLQEPWCCASGTCDDASLRDPNHS